MTWNSILDAAIVALMFATVGAAWWQRDARPAWPQRNDEDRFESPVIAMQFVQTASEVLHIVGPKDSPERRQLSINLGRDYVYIVAYWLYFTALGLLYWNSERFWWLAVVVALFAFGAALSDCVEDCYTLGVLETVASERDLVPANLHRAALGKFTCLFLLTLCLAPLPYARPDIVDFPCAGAAAKIWLSWFLCGACVFAGLIGVAGFGGYHWLERVSIALLVPLLPGLCVLVSCLSRYFGWSQST